MKFYNNLYTIRSFNPEDLSPFINYHNNLEWMKFQSYKGKTIKEYQDFLLSDPDITKGVQLAIIHHRHNKLVGDIYLKLDKDICWIGYTCDPKYCRRGYTSSALKFLITELNKNGVKNFMAETNDENIASIKLLEKLEFKKVKTNNNNSIYQLVKE